MRPSSPLISLRDWRIGLPTSAVRVTASVSTSAAIATRKRCSSCSRCAIGRAAHAGCAARAARARSVTNAGVASGTSAISAPVAGLWIFSIGLDRKGSAAQASRAARAVAMKSLRIGLPSSWVWSSAVSARNSGCHCMPNT